MPAESDLHKALAAVGESAPERPEYLDLDYADVGSVGRSGAQEERKYALTLESLALRLAVRLEMAERKECPVCAARNSVYPPIDDHVVAGLRCSRCGSRVDATLDGIGMCCYGTGKEQGR